ncbi:unnamed protein product, partial [Closterium sp. NIES-53]
TTPPLHPSTLPRSPLQNVRAVVGDRVYAALHANPFTDDKLLSTVDLSNQKAALKLACKLEAAEQIWMRQLALAREPQLSHTLGGSYLSTSSRDVVRLEESLQRVSSCLAAIRRRWPDLPQTTLDLAKIAFNGDIGKAVLESYSRVLEGAASNIRSRIRDVLHANYLFLNPQQFVDLPCDPHPQGLRHPTFSVLMPETVFDAVSMSSDNSESTNGSVRSFDSSRSGGSARSGKGARGGGGGGPVGGGDGGGGLGAAVGVGMAPAGLGYPGSGVLGKASAKWDMRPPRSPELRSPLISGAMGRLSVGGGAVSGGGGGGGGSSGSGRYMRSPLHGRNTSGAGSGVGGAGATSAAGGGAVMGGGVGGGGGGMVYPSSGSGGGGSGGSSPSASPSRAMLGDRFLRRTGSLQPRGKRGNRALGRSQSGGMADEVMCGMGMGGGGNGGNGGGGGVAAAAAAGGVGGGRGVGSPGYQDNNGASSKGAFSRRASLLLAASAGALLADWSALPVAQALPFLLPPAGFRLYVDRLDGYSFFYPDSWVEVRGSGQDCFFRSSFNLDENVSVEVSSPSSSRFASVRDLGAPQAAGERVEKQLLTEFMSTRLGVRREASLISSANRIVPAGTGRRGAGEQEDAEYYDVELNVKSYANNNQLAIMPDERVQVLEWNRRYLTVLAVANRRLYQLRLQVPERLLDSERPVLRQVMDSFRVFSVAE